MTLKTQILNYIRSLFKSYFFEKILIALTNGRHYDSFFAKIAPNYYQYSPKSYRKITRNNISYKLDISDYMEWLIYFGVIAEPREVLYGLIKKDYIIFDVGANIGETTLNFAKITQNNGYVHSFEPSKLCFGKLEHNLSLNKFNNIKFNNFGLGEVEGQYYLQTDRLNNNGGNRIHLESQSQPNIFVNTMDNYVTTEKINKVDFIKIDVEGFEYSVLKGGRNTIEKHLPILFIELDNNNLLLQNSSAKLLIEYLEGFYSKIINAENNKIVSSGDDFSNCHFDIIVYK